ncbi:MAG: VOC family protein [Cellvibrionaceae bacterium]
MKNITYTWMIAVLFTSFFSLNSFAGEGKTYMSAVALNIKNLEKSTEFYSQVFGMHVKRNINNATMNENIMAFSSGEGASLVLVQYKDREVLPEKSARIVFYSPDPVAAIEKAVKLGAEIVRAPKEVASMGTVIGIVRDLDGYLVEVIKK